MAASYTEHSTGKWHALLEEVSTELGTQRRRNSIGKFELKLIEAIDEVEALLDDRKIRKSNCEEKLAKLEASCSECREAYRAARSDAEGPRAPCIGTTPGQASGRVAGASPDSVSSMGTPSSHWSFHSVENENLADKLARREQQLEEYRIYRQAACPH